jgi:hypothetical protein
MHSLGIVENGVPSSPPTGALVVFAAAPAAAAAAAAALSAAVEAPTGSFSTALVVPIVRSPAVKRNRSDSTEGQPANIATASTALVAVAHQDVPPSAEGNQAPATRAEKRARKVYYHTLDDGTMQEMVEFMPDGGDDDGL